MPVIYGTVGAPSNTSAPDSSNQPALAGKSGEVIVAELHGIWYTAAYRGREFHGCSAIAGVILPRETTTAATFLLQNPAASGVNIELISFDVAEFTTTGVIGTLLLATSIQVATSVTAITATVTSGLVGSNVSPKAILASAATVVAMTVFWPLPIQVTATTTGTYSLPSYFFNGRLNLSPGTCVQACSNPIQTNSFCPAFDWAEWPI